MVRIVSSRPEQPRSRAVSVEGRIDAVTSLLSQSIDPNVVLDMRADGLKQAANRKAFFGNTSVRVSHLNHYYRSI